MSTQIKLPALGENITSGDVLSIFVSVGDVVAKDQDLIEIETDKATMPIPSPSAGKVAKILVAEGETVNVGGAIVELEASDAAETAAPQASAPAPAAEAPKPAAPEPPKPAQAPAPQAAAVAEPPAKQPAANGASAPAKPKPAAVPKPAADLPAEDVPGDGHSSSAAGPSVRRLARELGVDLRRVRPSGSGGRITDDDVRNHVKAAQQSAAAAAPKGVTPPGSPDSDGYGAVRREKMSRMRQTIARNMLLSTTSMPQLTNFDDADVTDLERLRKESAKDYEAQGVKLTLMPLLVKAIAVGLKHHPIVNASVGENGDEIVYKEYVNVGMAVDTPKGLVVPVIRDADRKGIAQLARDIASLGAAARDGTLAIEDMRGGTFTLSNLGAIGGTYSTPIINPPEAAILLVGRSRMMPQFIDGAFHPRLMMPLSLSYDHRIVDGAAAARFLNDVKGYLSNPGRLLLAPA